MKVLSFDVGIKNLAYCLYDKDAAKIEAWEVYGVDPATTRDFEKLCPEVMRTLEERRSVFDAADVVVVERQPGKNRKMKIVETYLHAYFVLRGKVVVLYSPSNKLRGEDAGMHGTSKYHLRKKKSVHLVDDLLEAGSEFAALFAASKKKDDLSDCLLQAIAFCKEPGNTAVKEERQVRARKPTAAQERKKRYSKANIKYLIEGIVERDEAKGVFVMNNDEENEDAALVHVIESDAALRNSILRFYSSARACIGALEIKTTKDAR